MKCIFSIVLLLVVSYSTYPQNASNHVNIKKHVAIEGFDPVSYFSNKPEEGKPSITTNYQEVIYQFSSQSNKTQFAKNPEKYIPQYGGWCAYAMGETGEKVKIDPETYKIIDGKLFLFYNFWGTNTLTSWNENEKELFVKANRNWSQIINK